MKSAGFTLLEVLVALSVAAVTLTAAGKAISMAVDGETATRERTLALWVAKNRLAERQSAANLPDAGTAEGKQVQDGLDLVWHEEISASPNPRFRIVRVTVARADNPDYEIARLSGYVVRK